MLTVQQAVFTVESLIGKVQQQKQLIHQLIQENVKNSKIQQYFKYLLHFNCYILLHNNELKYFVYSFM
ncbi:hypothetical protein [Geobacillus stearothermophilus]|uniref:hypothetical protein n=1 Tax=Geobacillus stearothermophilus TaxID=1422 RepID=UPI0024028CF2|nr:hypothetical protein [Geobacillus stearothermophilus]MDF9298355.1 hypothetical protein [Geobacillus stearothermophilus]